MLNFAHAIEEFRKYMQQYDITDGKIKLKINHTYGVVDASDIITTALELDTENRKLARLIALLHDIGRFEQLKEFNDYRDYKTLDHADLGVKILFEDGLIRKFVEDTKYDHIILKAIKNHNKLQIESGLAEEELLHAKIIRDADKTDNFRVKVEEDFEDIMDFNKNEIENSLITDKIYQNFMNNQIIKSEERITPLDHWISYIAFIFDFNFSAGLQYIQENNYINLMIDRIDYKNQDSKQKMEQVKKHALDYIQSQMKI